MTVREERERDEGLAVLEEFQKLYRRHCTSIRVPHDDFKMYQHAYDVITRAIARALREPGALYEKEEK